MNGNGNAPEAVLILDQLGGHDFLNMTEASGLVWDKASKKLLLSLKSPFARAKDGINSVVIQRLDTGPPAYDWYDDDWYDISFLKVNGTKAELIWSVGQVPGEDLPFVFTKYTGLDTHPRNN